MDSNSLLVYAEIYKTSDFEFFFGYLEEFIAQKNANVAVETVDFHNSSQHLLQFSIATTELLDELQKWNDLANSQKYRPRLERDQIIRLSIRAREQFEYLIRTLAKYNQSDKNVFRNISRIPLAIATPRLSSHVSVLHQALEKRIYQK